MKYIFLPKTYILLIFVLSVPIYSFSQTKATYAGLDFSYEYVAAEHLHPRIGIIFERQLTKRSGLETGLYFWSYTRSFTMIFTDSTISYTQPFSVSEKYISIPFLYKFYTNIVNIAVGPSFEYYVGWKQKSGVENFKLSNYSVNPALSYGLLAKVSRRFNLNSQLLLEPELILNLFSSVGYTYAGLGISVKYKL